MRKKNIHKKTSIFIILAMAIILLLSADVMPAQTRADSIAAAERRSISPCVSLRGFHFIKCSFLNFLQRNNSPPVAHIEVLDDLPGRLQLSAQGSYDSDGWIHHYIFRVYDAETGEQVTGPVDSRKPHVSIPVPTASPTQTLRVDVTVEDDTGHIDTAEALTAAATPTCYEDKAVTCWVSDTVFGRVTCTFKNDSGINYALQVEEILYPGQACNPAITSTTRLAIMGLGGSGGGGGSGLVHGGDYGYGGAALVGTTWEELVEASQFVCFGVAQQASHSGLTGGSGGASTIMRKCDSYGNDLGVILVAGGGGGGGPGSQPYPGDGGDGGIAISSTAGACPPNCLPGTSGYGDEPPKYYGIGESSSLNYGRPGGAGEGGSSDCDSENAAKGEDGFGGRGGKSAWGSAGWLTGNAFVPGATGQGGTDACSSGAGGGGYGGGASGSSLDGGGGGGSYAMKSSWDLSTIGFKIETNPGDGIIQFDFLP